MTTSDFLFQNSAPEAWTSPSYSNASAPEWWQAAAQGLIGRASQIAGQGYQQYSGPRIAGFDPLQQDAMARSTQYTGNVNNALNSATSLTSGAGNLFNQNDFNQFMSPYTSGVVDRIAQLGQRNLSENLLPAVNDTFIKAGQFGSRRNADFTRNAIRDANESIMGQQATALENAQRDAMSNYQSAQGRQLAAGQQMGALASLMGNENRNQLGFQNAMGAQGQAMQQQNLDLARSDFENQTNFPMQQLAFLNSIIRGYNPGTTTTTSYGVTPTNSGTNPLNSIAGLLRQWSGSGATNG